MIPLSHWLIFTTGLFAVGIYGAATRRSVIGIFIALELIFLAATVNLVAFSRTTSLSAETGQIFAFFILLTGLASAAAGTAILISVFHIRKTTDSDELQLLKW